MVWVVILIMLAAGIFGGAVNLVLSSEPPTRRRWVTSIVAGIGASLLIPLFLRTLSSRLLEDVLGTAPKPEGFFVLAGFCLLAAITSRSFIQSLSDRVLKEAREATRQAQIATQQVNEVKTAAEVAATTFQAARDAAAYNLAPTAKGETVAPPTFADVAAGKEPDDPWKGQFEGKSVAKGRALEARILRPVGQASWRTVTLVVRSTDPRTAPLTGHVQFYLHPTFGNHKPVVEVVDGVATLSLNSYGAFTVGVLADSGSTKLELDLSKHPDADEPWRSR